LKFIVIAYNEKVEPDLPRELNDTLDAAQARAMFVECSTFAGAKGAAKRAAALLKELDNDCKGA